MGNLLVGLIVFSFNQLYGFRQDVIFAFTRQRWVLQKAKPTTGIRYTLGKSNNSGPEDDDRRMTRVTLLQQAGYFVEVRRDIKSAQGVENEGTFDLVIIALRLDPERTRAYSNELASHYPGLPILLLTDHGVFAPAGTLGTTLEAGHPIELMSRLASMLAGSSYVRLIK
jgi:hypothetical protein